MESGMCFLTSSDTSSQMLDILDPNASINVEPTVYIIIRHLDHTVRKP